MLYNYLILNERDSHEIPTWRETENYNYCENTNEVIAKRGLLSSFFSMFHK